MRLKDIQSTAAALVAAIPEFAAPNVVVPVLMDDGSYPKLADREAALAAPGLVLIVTPIQSKGVVGDQSRDGLTQHEVGFHVIIEENVKVNAGVTGTGVTCEDAIDLILAGLSGKPNVARTSPPSNQSPNRPFLADDPPFGFFGVVDGAKQAVASFRVLCFINPT